MLNFISTGSAFNAALGNNSAYLRAGQTLVLFDCGGSVFGSLVRGGLLAGLTDIFVVITHTHPDHVGSLGDLILYNHHQLSARIMVIYRHPEVVDSIMGGMGVNREYYQFLNPASGVRFVVDNQDVYRELEAIGVEHSEKVFCNGYVVRSRDGSGCFYYSGDARGIPEQVLGEFRTGSIHLLYQDVSSFDADDNPHLSFTKLCQLIPVEMRPRVCCMHLDEKFDVRVAERAGFKVARSGLG
ncbi:MAG: MBL fold metallo-hydrolase [Syntrophomonadaceae bacterium]